MARSRLLNKKMMPLLERLSNNKKTQIPMTWKPLNRMKSKRLRMRHKYQATKKRSRFRINKLLTTPTKMHRISLS